MNDQEHPKSRARLVAGALFRWARNALAIVGLTFIVYHLCFNVSVVVSDSMAPTLQGEHRTMAQADWVLSEKVSYWFRKPRRWEVVRFRQADQTEVAKRIVGLPGETVSVRDLKLVIDGSVVPRPESLPFLRYYAWGNLNNGKEYSCGDGYYYLGDDSRDSLDSRFEGTVQEDEILGRAWLIIWPPSRMGFVSPS